MKIARAKLFGVSLIIIFLVFIFVISLKSKEKTLLSPKSDLEETYLTEDNIKQFYPNALVGQDAKEYLSQKLDENPDSEVAAKIRESMIKYPSFFEEIFILPDGNGVPAYVVSKSEWWQGKCRVVENNKEIWPFPIIIPIPVCRDVNNECERYFGSIASCYWPQNTGLLACSCTLYIFQW